MMRNISYEIIVNIAKFLCPKDIVSFSHCGKNYMNLCRDDFLFRILYFRDFEKYCKEFIPKYEYIISWKKLYTILYVNREIMLSEMREYYHLEKISSSSGTKKDKLFVTVNDIQHDSDISSTFVDYGYSEESLIETNKKTLRFKPNTEQILKISHMNLAHQIYKIDNELGRRALDDPYIKGPPQDVHYRFLYEGVCFWHKNSEMYHLVYPKDAFSTIFKECEERVIDVYLEKLNEINDFLQQIVSLTYTIETKSENLLEIEKDIEKRETKSENLGEIIITDEELNKLFQPYDLSAFEFLCKENILYVTCNRFPDWKYKPNMCIFHSREYDQNTKKIVETNCKNLATRKEFCEEHKVDHYYIKKQHRKIRQKLCNEEYINYKEKILPKTLQYKNIIFTEKNCEIMY